MSIHAEKTLRRLLLSFAGLLALGAGTAFAISGAPGCWICTENPSGVLATDGWECAEVGTGAGDGIYCSEERYGSVTFCHPYGGPCYQVEVWG